MYMSIHFTSLPHGLLFNNQKLERIVWAAALKYGAASEQHEQILELGRCIAFELRGALAVDGPEVPALKALLGWFLSGQLTPAAAGLWLDGALADSFAAGWGSAQVPLCFRFLAAYASTKPHTPAARTSRPRRAA